MSTGDAQFRDPALLELPKTRLRVSGGVLQRGNRSGHIILSIPLSDIRSIECVKRFDAMCLVFVGAGLALGAIALFVPLSNVFTAILYVGAVGLVAAGVIASRASYIDIHSSSGVVQINVVDMPDYIDGFVASVRLLIQREQSRQEELSESLNRKAGVSTAQGEAARG